jgi:hypothetical protein
VKSSGDGFRLEDGRDLNGSAGQDQPPSSRLSESMDELNRMIVAVRADRAWYHAQYAATKIAGHSIEAAACVIREKALLDAKAAIERAK